MTTTAHVAMADEWWIEGRGARHSPHAFDSPDRALARAVDSLWLAYQPIVCARTGAVIAHEALARTNEPSLGDPVALFAAARARRGRLRLGQRVRARLAADLAAIPGDVYTNVGAEELVDPRLLDRRGPLASFAERVVLEITEHAPLERVPDLSGRLARLRDLGFRFAVDDLGAGYSGHLHLAILEPEIVKLDMALVRGVDRDPARRELVRSAARLCRRLGSLVVAEGVETEAERAALLGTGCDALQGFLFGAPSRLTAKD